MFDDKQIYRAMSGEVSQDDLAKMQRVLMAWAKATAAMEGDVINLRIIFLSCVQTIRVMGPAYCKIAAATLLKYANE